MRVEGGRGRARLRVRSKLAASRQVDMRVRSLVIERLNMQTNKDDTRGESVSTVRSIRTAQRAQRKKESETHQRIVSGAVAVAERKRTTSSVTVALGTVGELGVEERQGVGKAIGVHEPSGTH